MAQAGKSSTTKRRSSSNSQNSKSRGTNKRSSNNRSSNSRSTKSRSANGKAAASRNGASAKLSSAGQTVGEAVSKAKTPLIAGGAVLAGAAAGALAKSRVDASKGPMRKLPSMPSLNLSKVDLETVKSAAERVGSLSRQAADIADAAEKTRKKNG
jgi:hypothetical protein